jgi:hypothetical protein
LEFVLAKGKPKFPDFIMDTRAGFIEQNLTLSDAYLRAA